MRQSYFFSCLLHILIFTILFVTIPARNVGNIPQDNFIVTVDFSKVGQVANIPTVSAKPKVKEEIKNSKPEPKKFNDNVKTNDVVDLSSQAPNYEKTIKDIALPPAPIPPARVDNSKLNKINEEEIKLEKLEPKPAKKEEIKKPEPKIKKDPVKDITLKPNNKEKKKDSKKDIDKLFSDISSNLKDSLLDKDKDKKKDNPITEENLEKEKSKDEPIDLKEQEGSDLFNKNEPITASEKGYVAKKIGENWRQLPGGRDLADFKIRLIVLLNKDGSVKDVLDPNNIQNHQDPFVRALFEGARRSIYKAAPFNELSIDTYNGEEGWNKLNLNFNHTGLVY